MLIGHVPPFPKVVQTVLDLLQDPETNASQLADVIKYDQAITVNILHICNAAYFGLPRKISSLDEGLVVIGNDVLKDIMIASSSARFLSGDIAGGYDLGQGDLWRHSVACGIMAKNLGKYCPSLDSSTLFTVGLLHDIGKRFLSTFVRDEYREIVDLVDHEKVPFVVAEERILGLNHAKLGGMVFEKWQFPGEMKKAVEAHHDVNALEQDDLTALLALANSLVVSMGIGGGVDGLATSLDEKGLERFGIGEDQLQLCMADLLVEMAKAEELLSL